MKYSIVLFDADNTLFDFDRAEEQAFQNVFIKNNLPLSKDAFSRYREINNRMWRALERKEITKDALLANRFAELFVDQRIDWPDPLAFNWEYLECLGECAYLMPNAEEVCEQLSHLGVTLAIVTNGVEKTQKSRLERSVLKPWFHDIIVSEEVGHAKPAQAYFTHVFDRMKLTQKNDVLIVGDSLLSDIKGGIDFGIDSCWYNPNGYSNDTSYCPTYEITDLIELCSLARGL